MGVVSAILIIIITIICELSLPQECQGGTDKHDLVPPLGTWMVAGCGMDLFINICLTILGYIPGHIHAFYLEYMYYDRREQAREGQIATHPAPGVYSSNVQTGGQGYGTIVQPTA